MRAKARNVSFGAPQSALLDVLVAIGRANVFVSVEGCRCII